MGLVEAGVGAAGAAVLPLATLHHARNLQARHYRETSVPHHERWDNWLLKLSFKGVHQLLSFGVVKRQNTFIVVDIDPDAVRDGTVEGSSLVVVLGCEALLQPVVQVDAPRCAAFPQLVESAEAPQGYAHGEGLALLVKTHLPVLLASVNHSVSQHCVRLCCKPVSAGPGGRCSLRRHQG